MSEPTRDRIEVSRFVPAEAEAIFAVLRDQVEAAQ
ncbi:hypothetical protein BKA01_004344 [Pseudonocardia eucalypti]|nr:hypothetical protein [Pseudonocardia eucalypti]